MEKVQTRPVRITETAYERLEAIAELRSVKLADIVDELSDVAFQPVAPFVRDMQRVKAAAAAAISNAMAQHPGPLPTTGDEVDEDAIQREVRTERAAASMEGRGVEA